MPIGAIARKKMNFWYNFAIIKNNICVYPLFASFRFLQARTQEFLTERVKVRKIYFYPYAFTNAHYLYYKRYYYPFKSFIKLNKTFRQTNSKPKELQRGSSGCLAMHVTLQKDCSRRFHSLLTIHFSMLWSTTRTICQLWASFVAISAYQNWKMCIQSQVPISLTRYP